MDYQIVCSECGHDVCGACGCCCNPSCDMCCCPDVEKEIKEEKRNYPEFTAAELYKLRWLFKDQHWSGMNRFFFGSRKEPEVKVGLKTI